MSKIEEAHPRVPDSVVIGQLRQTVDEKNTVLDQNMTLLCQKDAQLCQKDALLDQKDALLDQKDAQLRQKDALLGQKDAQLHEKDAQLQKFQEEMKQLKQEAYIVKQVAKKPPRNWRDMKCQKILKCGDRCWSVATRTDLIAVGVGNFGGFLVKVYDKKSNKLLYVIGRGQLRGGLWGVAFLDEETIVVSDYGKCKLFTLKGELLHTFDRGSTPFEPRGVTVSPDGHIYVCDGANHCVCVFDVKGKYLFSFGSHGSGDECFDCPRDLCFASDGLLYITDANNSRICVYDKDGKFIRKFPTTCEPTCIDATDCGHLIVSSLSFHKVMIYTTGGGLVRVFGECGSGLGQFYAPSGVSVDSDGLIYIADLYDNRIQVF
jgi:DNA-binding beta-propeller fold protein YncE